MLGLFNCFLFASGILVGYYIAKETRKADQKWMNAVYSLDPALFNHKRVLVVGTDQTSGSTDVMLTVESDGATTQIEQIPRETLIDSDKYGVVKANALYGLGGPKVAEQELERLTGHKIDHFVHVNLDAVRKISTAIGGLKIKVPFAMKYDDNAQNLHIDLAAGEQQLSGSALEGYIRFRHDGLGDIGRLERQQQVYQQIFSKVLTPTSLVHLPQLIAIARQDLTTDL